MPVIGRSGWERSSKPASTVEPSDSTNSRTFSEACVNKLDPNCFWRVRGRQPG
jgi:hypothetical protein